MLDAEKLLRRLTEQNVEFIVIGGLAMITHGSATVTEDLDLCYRRNDTNIAAISAALLPLHPQLRGAPPGLPFQLDPPTIKSGLNFTLNTDLGAVDLMGEVLGIGDYEEASRYAEPQTIFGLKIPVLSLDGLMAAKKATGRAKDQLHLLELLEIKKLREEQGE